MINISWTLKPVLADDSIKYSIPYSSFNFSASSFCIALDSSKSVLFPIKNIFVSGDEFCLKSFIHKSILSKLVLLFYKYNIYIFSYFSIKYTIIAREAFL